MIIALLFSRQPEPSISLSIKIHTTGTVIKMEIVAPRLSMVAYLVLFFVYVFVPSFQATTVEYCDPEADYAVKVDDVVISSVPVHPARPATFGIHATTAQPLSGETVYQELYYMGARIDVGDDDLCDMSSCPIQPGNFVFSHTQPSPLRLGNYDFRMIMQDHENTVLTCFTFSFIVALGDSSVASI